MAIAEIKTLRQKPKLANNKISLEKSKVIPEISPLQTKEPPVVNRKGNLYHNMKPNPDEGFSDILLLIGGLILMTLVTIGFIWLIAAFMAAKFGVWGIVGTLLGLFILSIVFSIVQDIDKKKRR